MSIGRTTLDMFPLIVLICLFFFWMRNECAIPKKKWSFSYDPDSISDGIMLTPTNYKGYVTIPEEIATHPIFTINHKRFRDLVCLWTLAEHGGVWNTPSMHHQHGGVWNTPSMFHAPTKKISFESNKEFHAYYTTFGIDTNYMECTKGSAFVRAWRDEYSRLAQFPCVEEYVRHCSVGQKFDGMDPMMIAFSLVYPTYRNDIELRIK